jgi:hypothetical protein
MVIVAIGGDGAPIAQRLRPANAPAVQDQRIGRERPFLGCKRRRELILHDDGIVGLGDADPVRDPQHVAIDRKARNAERVTENDVGRLPPDAG